MDKPFDVKLYVENVLAINPYISAEQMSAFLARKGHRYDVRTIRELIRSIKLAQNRG